MQSGIWQKFTGHSYITEYNYDISLKEPDANDSNSGKTEVSKNKKSPKNNHKISVDNVLELLTKSFDSVNDV